MPLIVQKFGGTSVNTAEKRGKVLDKIIAAKDKGCDVVVVVSAMGRKGEPYATDTFLDLLREVGPNPAPRTKDLLASCGEIISTCIVAHALEQRGYPACPMTGFQAGILTDEIFTNAEIKEINPVAVRNALQAGQIVVVAGFQGVTASKDVATLGRGGSDTTAIALGGALQADLVEIYTDVPGIAFTDPRLIAEAPYVQAIDFQPMYTLAKAGAKVIHPRAVRTAITYNRPFLIRSTFSDDPGTLIGRKGESFGGIYGIALTKGVLILKVQGNDQSGNWKRLALDEMFYRVEEGYCQLAAQLEPSALNDKECTVSEECDLVTVVWDPASPATAQRVAAVLEGEGILNKGFFDLQAGGAWAVPSTQSARAVRVVFDSLGGQKTAAV